MHYHYGIHLIDWIFTALVWTFIIWALRVNRRNRNPYYGYVEAAATQSTGMVKGDSRWFVMQSTYRSFSFEAAVETRAAQLRYRR